MANQVLLCDASAGDAYVEYDLGADIDVLWVALNMWVPADARAFFAANPSAIFLELLDATHTYRSRAWLQADGISTSAFDPTPVQKTPADGWHSYIHSYDDIAAFGPYWWGERFAKDSRTNFASGLTTIPGAPIRYVRLGVQGSTGDAAARLYFEQFRVATAYHLNDVAGIGLDDLWALTDYEGGFFGPGSDAGTTVVGDCSIVDDPDPLDAGAIDYTENGSSPQPPTGSTPRAATNAPTPFDGEVASGSGHFINRIRNGAADGKTDVALLNTFGDTVTDEIAVAVADGPWDGSGAPFGNGALDAVYLAPHNRWVVGGYHFGGSAALQTSPDLTPASFTPRAGTSAYSQVTGLAYDEADDIVVAVGYFSDDDFATVGNVAYSTDGGITWTIVATPWDGFAMTPVGVTFAPAIGLWAVAAVAAYTSGDPPAIITAPDPTGAWTAAPSDWDALGVPYDIEWLPGVAQFAILGYTTPLDGVDGSPTFAASLSPDGAAWTHPETAFDGGPGTAIPGTAGVAYGAVETPDGIYLAGWSTDPDEIVIALSTDDGATFPSAPDDSVAPLSSGDAYFQGGTAIGYRTTGDLLWIGGAAILDDAGTAGPMVLMGDSELPPIPNDGLSIATTSAWNDRSPAWLRLDGLDAPRRLTQWKIDRGRSRELDTTQTGTSQWDIIDRDGSFDTTVEDGVAGNGGFDPLRQAQVLLRNPARGTVSSLFRGYIDDLEVDMDLGARRSDVALSLIDGFGVMADLEMHPTDPPRFGTTPALASAAEIYFPPTTDDPDYNGTWGTSVWARLHRALDQAGWPMEWRRIASGNLELQGAVYGRYDSLLSVIFDAAEAEFPNIANAYISKTGLACFHGRFIRFNANAYLARDDAHRRHGHPLVRWKAGGSAAAAADPAVALIAGLKFNRTLSDIYNVATILPQNVTTADVPGALIKNDASIDRFGWRPISYEDLLVSRGIVTDNTAVEECTNFARFYVTNYKDPKTRVTQLVFKPRDPRSFSGPATWDLMCGVDIGDPIDLDTTHWGGLGGFHERYYVEGIHYQADATGRPDMPNVNLVLDVSPASFWAYSPFG